MRINDPTGKSGEDVLSVFEDYELEEFEGTDFTPVSLADQARAIGNQPAAAVEGLANLGLFIYSKATGTEFSPVSIGRPFTYSDTEAGSAAEDYFGLMTTGGGAGLLSKSGGVTKGAGKKIPNCDLCGPPNKRGNAPIGKDSHPVELHHRNQNPKGPLDEMTRTDHRLGDNFKKNYSNTGQEASKIDRSAWRNEQKDYWKNEWDSGRFNDM